MSQTAQAFRLGQKFRFKGGDPTIYTFLSIEFVDNEPIVNYTQSESDPMQAFGYYLSDLEHV